MTEIEWLKCEDVGELLRHIRTELQAPATPAGQRKFWLFGCAGCRLKWSNLTARPRAAVEFAERLADGQEEPAGIAAMYYAVERVANKWHEESPKRNAALDVCALLARETADSAADAPVAIRAVAYEGGGYYEHWRNELRELAGLLRDIFGNPFRPVTLDPAWRTSDVLALARGIYDGRAFDRMPILADALQDAGCDSADVLNHCRGLGPHVRGCWVVDLLLEKP